MTTYATLLLEVDGPVGILTLNRPDRHNAWDEAFVQDLTDALQRLAADERVRLVVLSAAGRSFCAGADGNWLRQSASYDEVTLRQVSMAVVDLLRILDEFPKPTIARVQGLTYGLGLGLVAACDMAVATYDAQFAVAEVRQGLLPAEVLPLLVAAIGTQHARRYLLTGARFSAAEAYRLGLVHEMAGDEDLLDETVGELLDQLQRGAPEAQAGCKRLIREVAVEPRDDILRAVLIERAVAQRLADEGREGAQASQEKRKPWWQLVD
jgi:methylglutaconyl-CoA hydratase